jgi:O-antigen ligase
MFWAATAVIGIAFFTLKFDSIGQSEDAWGSEAIEIAETATATRAKTRALCYVMLGVVGACAFASKHGPRLKIRGPLLPLVTGFVLWSILSILWSDEPRTSATRCVQMVFCFLGALGIGRQLSTRELCRSLAIVFCVYSSIGLLAELALGSLHPMSAGYRFSGGEHPNTQSQYCALICLTAIALMNDPDWPRRRSFWMLALGGPLLILTASRTAAASMLAAAFVCCFAQWKFQRRMVVVATMGLVASLMLFVSMLGDKSNKGLTELMLMGREESAESLTGRLPLWECLWEFVQIRPMTGFGYGGFWTTRHKEDLWASVTWVAPTAHNAYLDFVLNVGLIGAALLILAMMIGWWTALVQLRRTQDSGCAFILMFLTSCAIGCWSETLIGVPGVFMTFILYAGLFQLGTREAPIPTFHYGDASFKDWNCRESLADRAVANRF